MAAPLFNQRFYALPPGYRDAQQLTAPFRLVGGGSLLPIFGKAPRDPPGGEENRI